MESYPGREPEKLYNLFDLIAVVYDGTLEISIPSHGKGKILSSSEVGVCGRVLESPSSSVSLGASVRLAPLAASLGADMAIEGGKSPLAIKSATC